MSANLFDKWAWNDKEMTARVLIALREFYNVEHVGNVGSVPIVSTPFYNRYTRDPEESLHWNSYEWFTLCNNGGEINVEPINHPDRMRSIPYTSTFFILTAETIAWRIWCAMTNQEIDWNYNAMPGAYLQEPLKIQPKY